jgi:hypothetical protein
MSIWSEFPSKALLRGMAVFDGDAFREIEGIV